MRFHIACRQRQLKVRSRSRLQTVDAFMHTFSHARSSKLYIPIIILSISFCWHKTFLHVPDFWSADSFNGLLNYYENIRKSVHPTIRNRPIKLLDGLPKSLSIIMSANLSRMVYLNQCADSHFNCISFYMCSRFATTSTMSLIIKSVIELY